MDLTTVEAVKLLAPISGNGEDALLGALVTSVSKRAETMMGRHALSSSRTEVYTLPKWGKRLILKGSPVASVTSVIYGSERDFTDDSALTEHDEFTVDLEAGILHLRIATPYDPGFVQVVYTGGMAADTAAFVAAYPDVAAGVDFEVINLWKRRQNPAGASTFAGGALQVTGELGTLKYLEQAVEPYRRRAS